MFADKLQKELYGVETTTQLVNVSNIIAFTIGCGLYVNFYFGVRLSVSEVMAPLALLLVSSGLQDALRNPKVKVIIYSLVLYSFTTYLSDEVNEVPTSDFIRSFARPCFMLAFFLLFSAIFSRKLGSVIYFFWGAGLGALLHSYYNLGGDEYDFDSAQSGYAFFVFRIQPALNVGFGLASYYTMRSRMFLSIALALCATALSFAFGARSSAICWFAVTCTISFVHFRRDINLDGILFPIRNSRKFLLPAVLFVTASYYIYASLAEQGYLGEYARTKFANQSAGDLGYGPLKLVAGGRAEVVASILMIIDRPWIGHGSSSYCGDYFFRAFQIAGLRGDANIGEFLSGRIVRGHSIFFHAWATNGVATIIFWTLGVHILIRLSVVLFYSKDPLVGLLLIFIFVSIWDIYFSPLSVQARAIIPMLLSFGIFYVKQIQDISKRIAF